MTTFRSERIFLLALLSLAACREEQGTAPAACSSGADCAASTGKRARQDSPAAQRKVSAAERLRRASLVVLGTSGPKISKDEYSTSVTVASRLLDLPFGPVLLTVSRINEACHACAGTVDAIYLRENGDGLEVVKRYPELLTAGWGEGPKYQVTDKFTRFPALYFENMDGGQGYWCGGAQLVELTPTGPVTSDYINTFFSDADAIVDNDRPARELDGKIANIRKGRSFDMMATGSEKLTEHYVFRNGRYVRTVKTSALQC
jgi:hypothetical protein